MIDFRYHLISLIAVFLALGLGILMGSVVLDEQLVKGLNNQVKGLTDDLDEHRAEIINLKDRMDAFQEYASATEPELVQNALAGEQVVLVSLEGVDGSVIDSLTDAVETAGGGVASRLTLTDRFALTDQAERDQLALILGSAASTPADLRAEAGTELGRRVAAAAARRDLPRGAFSPDERLEQFVDELQRSDFLGIGRTSPNQTVPPGATFVIVGGDSQEKDWKPTDLAVSLGNAIAEEGVPVAAVEPSNSIWDFVDAFRSDGQASAQVTTVDHVETIPGRVGLVLALSASLDGSTGHYGSGPGASSVLPEPSPSA